MKIEDAIQTTFKNERFKAMINIKYTANWMNTLQNKSMEKFGLTIPQYNILRILRGAKDRVKVQIVKDRMIERAPNATRLMDKLCDKKLIERTRCEDDRRVVYVKISELGLEMLATIDDNKSMSFLEKLTEEEATLLSDLLDKIR